MKKEMKKQKKSRNGRGFLWLIGVSALSVALLIVCQVFFENVSAENKTFFENTKINGINVGNMSVAEAENVVLTDMLNNKNNVEIDLRSGGKEWKLKGSDFEVSNKIEPEIKQIAKSQQSKNFFQNMKMAKETKQNGQDFYISYTSVLSNLSERIDDVIAEIERVGKPATLVFMPENEDPFSVDEGQSMILVDRDELYQKIDHALSSSTKADIEVPIVEFKQDVDVDAIKNSVGLRSSFTTNYEKSSKDRKNNIKRALESFNGMIVESGQSVSFNATTGDRTLENGYQNAHIIVGGNYVDGVGGGVCQASTTLYNALLLADIDVISVNHHTLPASYVPLSFDAMVSGEYADLVFQNNLETPIYIKTICDDRNVRVEIYGEKIEDGTEIKHRAELIKVLPHNGDKIVADTKGAYADKILYKGEYFRLKYPREGYESKAYLQYYKNGELIREKEIRHDFYPAQDGIVMEGVEDAVEGMTIPASDVKIIRPQKVTEQSFEKAKQRLTQTN